MLAGDRRWATVRWKRAPHGSRAEFDAWRSAIVNEPRGSDAMVGALLCAPHRADCQLGVIFFNNVGVLGMCGHGTIGLVASLALERTARPGKVRIDTPVGAVDAELRADGESTLANVPSYRQVRALSVEVPGVGRVTRRCRLGRQLVLPGREHGLGIELANVEALTDFAWRVRQRAECAGLSRRWITSSCSANRWRRGADSRNFVLCPGKAYDRSPCGTGTSAKLACLAADGELAEGEEWCQESLIGSRFRARYRWLDRAKGIIEPTIIGRAHVTARATLLLDPADPFCWGIR